VTTDAAAAIRAQALEVAAGWSPPDAPPSWRLTAALLRAIAGHDELVGRLAALPPGRLPALLASAAITFLVRRDRPAPLASYFPEPGPKAVQPGFDDGFWPAVRAFCSDRLDDIAAECAGRRYQMNEVARCAQLALGIAALGEPGPVAVADLGTGAGLGLHLDRYRSRVDGQVSGPATGSVGGPASGLAEATLTLDCAVRGPLRPPAAALPPIAERAGLDVHPVDLADPAARAWLEACAPPEATALSRLSAAIEVAWRHPVPLVAGDVIDALPGVLDRFPPARPVLVTDAYLAVFLSDGQREQLAAICARAARRRPVTWLSLDPLIPLGPDGRHSVQGLPLPAGLVRDYAEHGVFAVLSARTFRDGADDGRLLARAHPSGQWVEWLAGGEHGPAPGG
jgi:hypothetical protein